MKSVGRSKTGDGRVVIFIVLACALTVINLFKVVSSRKDDVPVPINLAYTTQEQMHTSIVSSAFELAYEDHSIPNNLLPLFFRPVQVNSAEKELLVTIKGIGPELAAQIIEFREEHGPFRSSKDLMKLSGVGISRSEYFDTVLAFDEAPWKTD